ncbi:MFS transporter [Streptomyces sp. NPDC052042]|uniref:MFS transporter n=1 Tax=Streptomyces sp. NPDC052042 TaxID=3365683 RepID=UPI0037D5D502
MSSGNESTESPGHEALAGSALVGRQIDVFGSRRLLPILATGLLASFVVIAFLPQPVAWLVAILVWGATGWASVPTLQDALTRSRPEATTFIVAFQMAAMYLGSAVGSALGTALLGSGAPAGSLPMWAVGAQVVAVVLALIVSTTSRKPVDVRGEPESRQVLSRPC